MRAAAVTHRESVVVDALQGDIVVACVGPVAADALATLENSCNRALPISARCPRQARRVSPRGNADT